MPAKFQFDVFLSHNAKDKPKVRRLAERLRGAGLRVWFDEWNVRHGNKIPLTVDEGLEQSLALLLCVSSHALASGWVALERSTALHRDPSNENRRFIPILLDDCELPDTLRRYKYLDFRKEGAVVFEELLKACHAGISKAPRVSKPTGARWETRLENPSKQANPAVALEHTLRGHRYWVNCLAVSPDGKWAASGSKDSTVKIWDLETGSCRWTLSGHTSEVRTVAITPDGKLGLSGSDDKTVRVWDVHFGKQLAAFSGHAKTVRSVAASPKGFLAVSGGDDRTLRIWDLKSRLCVKSIRCGSHLGEEVHSCAIHPECNQVLSGHRNGEIRLWNLITGECLTTLKSHSDIVRSLQITADGRFAVSGSRDMTLKIWDLESARCAGTLEGHQDDVDSVSVSLDSRLIASTGFNDKSVRLWDWKSGVCLQVINGSYWSTPTCAVLSPDCSRLLVGTVESRVFLYSLTGIGPAPAIEQTRRYVNAKVVLLGEGTVGKTSLAHRLVDDKYVVRDRTHGMNVWRLELPLPSDSSLEREALLWDLAGQEDYRLIHQLFLNETALALLLANPQTKDPFAEAGDWLKALKVAANNRGSKREAEKLLILSQVDVGGPKLSDAKIKSLCSQHGLRAWLMTSAKRGDNCSDKRNGGRPSKLKELIAKNIPWDKLPWTSTPRLLAELKNAVLAMRDERDIRLLRFAELSQRLERALPGEKFGESEVRTAVTLLANHGLARPLEFGDLVLLQPELLNGYAAAIIRAARAHTDEIGCVLEADIYGKEFDFTGVDRLTHRPDEELLLRALVQTLLDHSLCISEDTAHGRHLVFPSQYRRDKILPRDPDIFVSYTFCGEWQTIWTTLVVRLWYSQEFAHKELWRNAVEFASPKGFTLGLKIDNERGEGMARISLYFDKEVPDELKAIFIEYVHRHLARFGCEVSRERRYLCPACGKSVKDLEAVRKRLVAKKVFITCQECDEKVPLVDFIEQRVKSDPTARKILAMDVMATRALDAQALEQILIGHMMAIAGEANQIFRPVTMFDHGIDGEVEFKDDDGKASGRRIYVQLKSGNSYLRTRKGDGNEVFDVTNERHLEYWVNQPVEVYLVIRQTDEATGGQIIRWMNVTRYLKERKDKQSRQILFAGEKLDMEAVWKVRDQFFPKGRERRK